MRKKRNLKLQDHPCRRAFAAGLLLLCLVPAGCGEAKTLMAYERGMAYLESGDRENAFSYFEESSRTEGEKALGYRGLGLIYMETGDYKNASFAFADSLEAVESPRMNKDFVEDTRMYLAQAYDLNGQPDKAMTVYSQLLDGDKAAEAYLLRGKLYAREEKFGQAGQDFQRAVELNPSYEFYLQIYDTYASVNRKADGAAFLREARVKSSNSAEDAYQLGRISYFLGEYEQAKDELNRAINGKVKGAAALLGRIYLDEGDVSAARAVFQKAVDSGVDAAAGHNGLALCQIEMQEYQMALQQIHEGLMEGDRNVAEELLFNEIIVYERMGQYEQALEKMDTFMSSYPANKEARHEYEFLKSRIEEFNSIPEDVSEKVWEDIIAHWEDEDEEEYYEEEYSEEEYSEEEYPEEYSVETYSAEEYYDEGYGSAAYGDTTFYEGFANVTYEDETYDEEQY